MKITCRPDSSSVSGPNIGCIEVTATPALRERRQPGAQRRFQRTQVEHHAARPALRELLQDGIGRTERRGHHDEVVRQRRFAPVGDGLDAEPWRPSDPRPRPRSPARSGTAVNQPPILPAPPITSARRPLPRPCAATLACSWVVSEERISSRITVSATSGETPMARGAVARAEDHLALARIVAGRIAGGALDARDLAAGGLPVGDDLQQLPIQLIQMPA